MLKHKLEERTKTLSLAKLRELKEKIISYQIKVNKYKSLQNGSIVTIIHRKWF